VVARGEVWWYEHPAEGRRPYLVLHRDEAISVLHHVLAVPATRTRRGIPTEVELDAADGMPQPCVLSLDNLRPIRPTYLTTRIATLGPERMRAVCDALRAAIVC
jgi:mRNA interferase MazF